MASAGDAVMTVGRRESVPLEWTAVPDPPGRFSTGIPDFDRVLGGGFRRGSFALFNVGSTVGTEEIHQLFTPLWLNFLAQSRGSLAVLPGRESPAGFRQAMLRFTTRRRVDARVRIVDYIGEADPAPYVVPLRSALRAGKSPKAGREAMDRMAQAERAVAGARGRPFLESNALEVLDTLVGSETASRMLFFGIKRTRGVGNLGVALARPGLGCIEAVRGLVDYEFDVSATDVGLKILGRRPTFAPHVVVHPARPGPPHVVFVPPPRAEVPPAPANLTP